MPELTRERVEQALTAAVPGRMPEQLTEYWVHGKGAAKIRWGTDGSFDRCVRALRKYFPRNPQGLCARLHKRATGEWPAEKGVQSSAGWAAPSDVTELAARPYQPRGTGGRWSGGKGLKGEIWQPRKEADVQAGAETEEFRAVSGKERDRLAEKGEALPDGSFPIANESDLRNAIQAVGRAKDQAAAKAHIRRRARELDREDLIPDTLALEAEELTAHAGHDDPMVLAEGERALALLDEEDDFERSMVPMVDRWEGLLAPIGEPTGDGRIFTAGSLTNRELPVPLLYQTITSEGHKNAVVVGRITEIEHRADGTYGAGDFLPEEIFEKVREAKAALDGKVVGPSVDLDDVSYTFQNADGSAFDEAAFMAAQAAGEEVAKPRLAVTDGRVSAATLVPIPAFSQARPLVLSRVPDEEGILAALEADLEECEDCFEVSALAASGYVGPELVAFAKPELEGPTPLTITDDGRVFGHLATWSTCHVGFPGTCVTPPNSATDYAYFHTGSVQCADGTRLPVGRLVVGAPHANLQLAYQASAQHYDNTGRVAALVRAYEDDYGICLAGVMVPDLDEEARGEFAANPLSGDWRRVGGSLELIGAISVPVPGFPVARVTTPDLFAEPEQLALVAAGVFHKPATQAVDEPSNAISKTGGAQTITVMIDGKEFSGTVTLSASSSDATAAGPLAQESLAEQLDRELEAAFGMLEADRERVLAGLDLGA